MSNESAIDAFPGRATAAGTAAYAFRFPDAAPTHFRQSLGLTLASIGLGTYLGDPTEEADRGYIAAVEEAVRSGCNVLDSAINYRAQRSERAVRAALLTLAAAGFSREELLVCTKGGFLSFDGTYPRSQQDADNWITEALIRPGVIAPDDLVGGSHCMTPDYLRHQLGRSLENLGLGTVDVYYVHNPESQLGEVSEHEFYQRLTRAFAALEAEADAGRIVWYGTATWSGFREEPGSAELMSLERVVNAAREAGGENHRFRFVQLPINLAMPEALVLRNQTVDGRPCTLLDAARELGITVIASGSMLQARLARGLPEPIVSKFPALPNDAARAIQFARSVPGVTTALVGMGRAEHVRENLALAAVPPIEEADFVSRFSAGA